MLALYHFGPVANSMTPLLGLLEKGVPFEDKFLSSRRWEHHTPEFQAISPEGMVPVLVHDDLFVTESTVINEYVDEAFDGPALRPATPFGRAQMRVWTKYVDEFFCPALTVLGAQNANKFASKVDPEEMAERLARMPNPEVRKKWETISKGTGFADEQLAEARSKLGRVVAKMEKGLEDGREWFVGDYSLADIKLFSMAPALEFMTPEFCNADASPKLIGWLRRMAQRPAVIEARTRGEPRPA